ncbi:MAG: HAD-IA family hydrolase, partial [Erysipelotrichia bacterium]|nr:HAD-IA family hydrolase [Erysipelotrichia bacterium]
NAKRDIRLFYQWFGDNFDEEKYRSCHDEYYKNAEPIDYNKLKMKNLNETLHRLKKDGHHLSLVSSSNMKSINYIIDLYDIRNYFDYLISGDDFHESKPDPEVYLYAKSKYDHLKEKIFVVEDSDLGIEAGKRAGLTVIAKRDDRFNYDQSKADYIIEDLTEIIDIVKNER